MKEKKIKAAYLAAYVGISPAVLSKKLNGRTPWRLDECYAVLDALEVDRRRPSLQRTSAGRTSASENLSVSLLRASGEEKRGRQVHKNQSFHQFVLS